MPSLPSILPVGPALVTFWKKSFGASQAVPTQMSLQSMDGFESFRARLARYSLYWAFYENSPYDSVHPFARSFKEANGLYEHTRGVVNPVHRLVEMWSTMTWNGGLDVEAGDGKSEPTAIPIITKNDALRPPIAQLWKDSAWLANKNMVPRLGSALGDVGIRVTDDTDKGCMRLDVVHPASIRWLQKDYHGNVKSYLLEEWRLNPDYAPIDMPSSLGGTAAMPVCLYSERCYRDGSTVVIETFKDGKPFDWDGFGSRRDLDYGFCPFVVIHHKRVGPRDLWGWSEPHAGLKKFMESDDVGSKLDDQIRKVVEGAWFITNANEPGRRQERRDKMAQTRETASLDPSRDQMKIIYGGNGGTAVPLLFPLDIQFTTLHLDWLSRVFEKDYPELQFDSMRVSGDASAKALREVRKKAVTKFNDGRVVYDSALVQAQSMAVAIGGYKGYDGYQGFNLDSYKAGKLDHRIGSRPVFEVDALDRLEEQQAFWTAAGAARTAGCPLEVFLSENGWTDLKIQDYIKARDAEDQRAMMMLAAKNATAGLPKGKTDAKPSNPQTAQSNP